MPTVDIDLAPGQHRYVRWENPHKRRYYEVRLQQNLFEEWELYCAWGGIGTNLGNAKSHPASSHEEAAEYLRQIAIRRKRHKYVLVREK